MIDRGTAAFRRIALTMVLAGFTTFATLYGVQPLLPLFSDAFHVSPAAAGLSMSATTMSMAIGMLGIGAISDLWSRKRWMTVSLLASAALSLLLSLSPNFPALLLLRVLQGFTLAALPAIAMTYLSEEIAPTSLGYAMGLYISGNSLGGMLGRLLSGAITDWLGWPAAMFFLGVLGVASGILFSLLLPPSAYDAKRSLQRGPLLTTVVDALRQRELLLLFGMGFGLMGCFVCLFNYIGFHLSEAPYRLSQTWLGWIFSVYLAGTFSSTWMGKQSVKHGMGTMMLSGVLLMIVGSVLTLHASLPVIIAGLAIFSFGFFGSHSIASSWVGRIAGELKAQASSLYLFFYYIGSSVIGAFGGTFWSAYDWGGIVLLILVILLPSLLVSLKMTKRQSKAGRMG